MTYVVDTDVLIDALNGRSDALDLLDRHSDDGLAVSVISLGEIFDGAVGAPDPDLQLSRAQGFLAPFRVLPIDGAIMLQFARLRVLLRQRGQLIPDFDLVIAATALTHDLTIMTRNRRHFGRIENVKLYEPSDATEL